MRIEPGDALDLSISEGINPKAPRPPQGSPCASLTRRAVTNTAIFFHKPAHSAARTNVCSGGYKAQRLSVTTGGSPSDRVEILVILSIKTESSQVGTNAEQMPKQSHPIHHRLFLKIRWKAFVPARNGSSLPDACMLGRKPITDKRLQPDGHGIPGSEEVILMALYPYRSSSHLWCIAFCVAGAVLATQATAAQRMAPQPRITAAIDNSHRTIVRFICDADGHGQRRRHSCNYWRRHVPRGWFCVVVGCGE